MSFQVSIIIPSLNSSLIAHTIDSLHTQSAAEQVLEILVVGRDDAGLIKDSDQVRFIDTGHPVTAPVARNLGIEQARGQYLAFIDADCLASSDWLHHLLQGLQAGHAVVGGSVAFPSRDYLQLCYNLTMFHDFLTTSPAGTHANMGTLNLCVARGVVTSIGLMDERLDRGQDTEWTLRMRRHGYALSFIPEAVVTHLPEVRSLRQILTTWYRSGMFNAWVRRQYRDLITPPPFDGRPWLQRMSAPAIALAVTVRIFGRDIRLLRYAHTFPVILATKVAWCWGASEAFEPSPEL